MEEAVKITESKLIQVRETLNLVRNTKTYDTWKAREMILLDLLRDFKKTL